jgi:hypothetical protein
MTAPYRRRNRINGQFSPRLAEMLESPRVLSAPAHRVLARVEIAHQGGFDYGKPPVTFSDFVQYSTERHAIVPAIRECVALGFLTEHSRADNRNFRQPGERR